MKTLVLSVLGLLGLTVAQAAAAGQPAVALGVECEEFQFPGDWNPQYSPKDYSGQATLSNGQQGAKLPAVTGVSIPRAGRYWLWVRAVDFPEYQPGARRFTVSVAGKRASAVFGASGKPGYTWEQGGQFELPAGPTLLGIHDVGCKFARADAIFLTTDAAFTPTQRLGKPKHPRIKPLELPVPKQADPLCAAPLDAVANAPTARLENEFLRLEFLPAKCAGQATVCPRALFKQGSRWQDAGINPDAEAYSVLFGKKVELLFAGYYPTWRNSESTPFRVRVGGVEYETCTGGGGALWEAGKAMRFRPRAAQMEQGKVKITFHRQPLGELAATWELRPGEHTARVTLTFTPAEAGQYSLGYHLFSRRPLAEVEELLLPMMWQRKRFPSRPLAILQSETPTPVALLQVPGAKVLGVCGAPEEIPYAWPDRRDPRFALSIRSASGEVQPAIYGPVPGTARTQTKAGAALRFQFRVLLQAGDWYAGYRTAADEVFGWRDYRSNVGVSLTDAALNMIDLVMDDVYGGWWDRGRGPYQIETLNGVTHSSPLLPLSLYWLTGNEELYRKRTLPTMEFALSRTTPHFSPVPEQTGTSYPAGAMSGPIGVFGSTLYGGLWEMTQRRTPAFRDIALPPTGVKLTSGYGHGMEFEEWLARHLLTGEPAALAKARQLADRYLAQHVLAAPQTELTPQPFFNVSFVPNWEGLLRMYEATRERRYLDGAVFGARQLMTSVWTQPVVPPGEATIHPGGEYAASSPSHLWWKGPDTFRLGYPRKKGDAPQRRLPAWIPSNVGLGFEQPITYSRRDSGGALIYQSAWSANFLRLAAYSGDAQFETYARNAVLGRWGNYPGYYVVGLTDLPLSPRYPYAGPDVSCIYYHHILPHLAWTIDYLVAEAGLRSDGKIHFPSQRQHGYVWFDSRCYGHAPGTVLDTQNAWLWFDRGVVQLDNPACNYLLAHTADRLCVALINESRESQSLGVTFLPEKLGFPEDGDGRMKVQTADGRAVPVKYAQRRAELTVAPRQLVVLTLDGLSIRVATHHVAPAGKPGPYAGTAAAASNVKGIEVRAAAIQVRPGSWNAYLWCTAPPLTVRETTFHYQIRGAWRKATDSEYPFELSAPVDATDGPVRFRLEGRIKDGQSFATPEAVVGPMQ